MKGIVLPTASMADVKVGGRGIETPTSLANPDLKGTERREKIISRRGRG